MPKRVFQCSKCGHVSESRKVIAGCEGAHLSLKKAKIRAGSYLDMVDYPDKIEVQFKTPHGGTSTVFYSVIVGGCPNLPVKVD